MEDQWKLLLVLIMPCLCFDSKVTLVKNIGKEPDVTPICSSGAPNTLMVVVCNISTERARGEECRLLYQQGWGFENKCDPRFRLMTENQTVFLHLSSLTPADSGNYTCKCSRPEGTHILQLNISVEASYEVQHGLSSSAIISIMAAFIILPGVVFGRVLWGKYFRDDASSEASGLSGCETPGALHQDDTYEALRQPQSDLYENVSLQNDSKRNSFHSKMLMTCLEQDVDGETDENCDIYENL